ncbi:Oidioi.mRNA.OKI2018_I69.PAR.g12413.t1.cds [Oikopleura dioica]|uniref:Oidioi.mRNA.OKI2018_I69.PAR.g12413.t1.cds n=1 Tax=Oikopleura dioica TaxID=34765 RepID=A0ABN7S3U5_OIKDI|nr:Oidioi.mRNA.OKI2018_I69.PAR.g12413.t1.cds [Oikopleura dioica]
MGSPTIDLSDPAVILSEIKRGTDLSIDAAEKGDKVVTDLARRIIELSIADPSLVRGCIENADDPALGHEILRLSFDYRNFAVAKDAIESGVTFQEVVLLADETDLEKIGSSIYEMYRQFQDENVIDFFCNQLIGSKSMLRRSIAKEASLYSDTILASALERDFEVDPILTQINRRLQRSATKDNRERIIGPTPLGSGSFGHVFPLCSRFLPYQNWELKALKVLNVQSKQSFDNILREITLLERCREHRSLLRFEKTFYIERNDGSPPLVCLETEFCNGGDLISFLKRINKRNLCEFDVGIIILQLAAAVQFLQTNPGIIHRDIKPENVLIKTEADAMGNFVLTVKLADFGLSTLSEKKKAFERTTRIGTIQYMAPEMLMGEPYDCRIDNYGVGLVAYFLSTGVHPYEGPDNFQVFLQHVISNSINFEPRVWNDRRLSKDAIVGIIQSCLTKRVMIHDFIRHPWFLQVLENDTQSRRFIEYHKAVCNNYTPPPPVLINRRAIFPDPDYSQNSSLFSQPRMSQF